MQGKKCGIYKISYLKNNSVYIGQSIDIDRRIKEHKRKLKANEHSNNHMQNIYNKYGIDFFNFEILELCTKELLDTREIYWIKQYDSHKNGFNQTDGGVGSVGFFRTEEYKKNLSIRCKELEINKKPIVQYSLIGEKIKEFDSITSVFLEFGYDISSIAKNCKGFTKYSYGFVWRYEGDAFEKYYVGDSCKNIMQYTIDGNFVRKYKNKYEILNKNNFCTQNIKKCCEGKIAITHGYVWRYEGDDFNKYDHTNTRFHKRIYQLDINNFSIIRLWDCLKEVQDSGIYNKNSVKSCCNNTYKKYKNYKWIYEYDYKNKTEKYHMMLGISQADNRSN